ncbi:DVU_1555 family C-GCAxxG-C-C protein [Aggregatilinea lenta]|uniref:DVU_1555 family C-GCAxxG-C-C protein n=1 Tax=Aggregatilinea lenta TaxID=913108 RepID=UPI000E5AD89B|nr:DV_1555 family C-GCAxxG-C-C protein [Aggregatilinea lenta]
MDDLMRMLKLKQQGFYCSQILVSMGLDDLGKTNLDVVRAARGLAGGLGFAGETCGALTGGACLLGLHFGKGTVEEKEDPRLDPMVQALVSWFKDEYGQQYGGIRCNDILANDPSNMPARCPGMVVGTYQKVQALLAEADSEFGDQEL